MHEWYSHSYFTDDLPLRRASEKTFQSLADLKSATGNAVQPFLSPVRPRLPPNLPIPLAAAQPAAVNAMTDSVRAMGLSTPTPTIPQPSPYNQYHPERSVLSPQHFAPQNAFANQIPSPGGTYLPSPSQWGAPQPRMNTFGSVGMPSPIGSGPLSYAQQPQPVYSPVIGGHVQQQRDFYSPVAAHPGAPWGAPQHQQYAPPQPPWQPEPIPVQQPQQQYQQQPEPQSEPAQPVDEPSYFPPNELAVPEPEEIAQVEEPEAEKETVHENVAEEKVTPAEPEPTPKSPVQAESSPAPEPKPPVSVWGQKAVPAKSPAPSAPASRKSSFATPTPAMTPAKPAASAASLPAKPVVAETVEVVATPEKPVISSRPAPWAEGRTPSNTGPSLREIQEAEAKEAEARKAARAAAASPAPAASSSDDLPSNLTWGLPTSQKSAAPAPAVSSPSVPAWGGADSAPKKTLKQIQEEEEKRKAKAAQAVKVAQSASAGPTSSGPKRGYADLAAVSNKILYVGRY